MKKIISIVLVLFLVIGLASCSSSTAALKKEYTFDEFMTALKGKVTVTQQIEKSAEMIGAVKGTGFFVGEKSYEVYEFSDAAKIKDASDGTFKFTIQGFGDFEMKSVVNGKFVMLYKDGDDSVINAFKGIV